MGGRFAIIAAALDTRIAGVLVISTSGFGMQNTVTQQDKFMASINPDMYIGKIAPRRIVMFHSKNDTVIPFEQAQQTFSFAGNPKEFFIMPFPCDHGYCAESDRGVF